MKADKPRQVVMGNVYNKYASTNPLARHLFKNFLTAVRGLIAQSDPRTILEVGCGEGYLTRLIRQWHPEAAVVGVDLSGRLFDRRTLANSGIIQFLVQSVYRLGFREGSFDLVVVAEVLEHLEEPEPALEEIFRVSRRDVLLSVPREPVWRLLNLARLSYVRDWGNTPGHVQHWSSREFRRLVERNFQVLGEARPLPWTVILARKSEGSRLEASGTMMRGCETGAGMR